MPSSPSLASDASATIAAWQPLSFDSGMTTMEAFALPAFETDRPAGPTLRSFAIDRTTGIPADLLASETAAARAQGYAAGYATGIAEARAATAARLAADAAAAAAAAEARDAATRQAFEALFDAADDLEQRAVPAASEIEDEIVSAAWEIASAIVGQVLADEATRSRAAVSRALSLAPAGDDVTVTVSPADFIALGGTIAADGVSTAPLRRERGLRTVTIAPDEALSPGDAVARCGATTIDARLAEAIARVKQVLAP